MNAKELAQQLNGREYGRRSQMTPREIAAAKAAGIVVAYGASDDLLELEGAVTDELGGPGTSYFTKAGLLVNKCEDPECPYFEVARDTAAPLELVWRGGPGGPAWTFKTAIPHETFNILEDGDLFCVGVVFALSDVPA